MVKTSQRIARPEFWTAISTSVLAAAAVAALWVARSQLREFHAESQVEHLLALAQQFEQEPMATYRRGLAADISMNLTCGTLSAIRCSF